MKCSVCSRELHIIAQNYPEPLMCRLCKKNSRQQNEKQSKFGEKLDEFFRGLRREN